MNKRNEKEHMKKDLLQGKHLEWMQESEFLEQNLKWKCFFANKIWTRTLNEKGALWKVVQFEV